jgi:hypothetical protein
MFGDRGWLCVHSSAATPYSNRYSNPANFGGGMRVFADVYETA